MLIAVARDMAVVFVMLSPIQALRVGKPPKAPHVPMIKRMYLPTKCSPGSAAAWPCQRNRLRIVESCNLPRMRKHIQQTLNEDPTMTPRILRRSDMKEAAMVQRNAAAYGGTVKSCARSPSNPSPCTMVGAKRDKEPIRQPTPVYAP